MESRRASKRSSTRDHPLHPRCFCTRKTILDAVLIANEIVDEKKRSGEEGVVFKIDFEKAYDHVKWDFLDHVLEKKGFSSKWRSWMRDVLSRMLLKAEERNLLEGFRVGRNRCKVTHLQFADDTILFASPREEEFQTLKSLLLVFGQISGLKVNLDKSNLFGINLDQNHLSREPTACGFWDPVIERISRRLDGWQRLTYPLVVGSSVQAEDYRGFGDWEDSFKESCSSREMVVESDGHTAVLGKAIAQGFQDFSKYTRFIVGDGERIRFWEDLWWGDQTLKGQYPRLFRVVMDKNIPISSILGSSRPFSWNFNFRRNLTDSEIEDLERLMHSLDCMNLSNSASDARSWFLCSSEGEYNDLLQLRRPTKLLALTYVSCVWNKENQQIISSSIVQLRWVVAQTFSASQDGLGSSEKHFRHDVHQLQGFGKSKRGFSFGGRISHPPFVLLFYQYILVWFPIKKNVDKEELWAELGDIKGLWSDLWCIGGDFNVVRFPRERRKNSRIPFAMKCFLEVIEELHLRDLPLARGCFTWCELLPRPTSNLAPILLDGGRIKSGKSPFHFENMWLRVEGFKDLVKSWWTSYTFSGSFSHILACK
ncbi:hypothetical protein CK203_043107, partial [Vitis vinifera]